MRKLLFFIPILFFLSCGNKQEWVDLVIYNANIYTVDSSFSVCTSMAINNGKIVATGTDEEIKTKYNSSTLIDAEGKTIFPGFIDAHCHFLGYGLGLQQADLVGTRSFDEVLKRLPSPTEESFKTGTWIIGRGWDQNDWDTKEYPTNEKLNSLFPNTPVFLTRVDGHAALVNETALRLAGINEKTKINGGEFILKDGKLTGILIDNAVDLVSKVIPQPTKEQKQKALLAAQKNCFAVGLTTVDDAGLMKREIDIIDELQKKGDLKMRIYAMLSDSAPNYAYYLKKGPYKTDKLNVRSFKFYADGALGSRGACLLKDYEDKKNWKGFLLSDKKHFEKYAKIMYEKGFQMNTHCIGDSAVRFMLSIYSAYFDNHCISDQKFEKEKPGQTLRWRIEHHQVTTYRDLDVLNCINLPTAKPNAPQIIPSIQPTHATSDMYWAQERLGKERIKYAYAYKYLLNSTGMVALGTDFPVEDISPFKTFYAAVVRKDAKGFPATGFQPENALTRQDALRGMTIWAARANFEETEKGSIEKGKLADFVVLDQDLIKTAPENIPGTKVISTFINGQKVYTNKQ